MRVVSGRTDRHLCLIDLRAKEVTGKDAEDVLERAHITVNKNAIPNDPQKPMVTSGIRIGSAALTTRGLGTDAARAIAHFIANVLEAPENHELREATARRVRALCLDHPVYAET